MFLRVWDGSVLSIRATSGAYWPWDGPIFGFGARCGASTMAIRARRRNSLTMSSRSRAP